MKHYLAHPIILALFCTLTACGGGQTGSSMQQQPSSIAVEGTVTKGPVAAAQVMIHQMNPDGSRGPVVAGPFTTNPDGGWRGNVPAGMPGPFMLIARGGSYKDEATGEPVRLEQGDELRGVIPGVVGDKINAPITPYTHAMVEATHNMAQQRGNAPQVLQQLRQDTNRQLGFDPTTVLPPNPLNIPPQARPEQKQYAALLGGFAQLGQDPTLRQQLPGLARFKLMTALSEDMADGKLDGRNIAGLPIMLNLPKQSRPLPPLGMNLAPLNQHIQNFIGNHAVQYGGIRPPLGLPNAFVPPKTDAATNNFQVTLTQKLSGYHRPEVIHIQNKLYLAAADNKKQQFSLFEVGDNLTTTNRGNLVHTSGKFATDIRVTSDGNSLWYGIENVSAASQPACGLNKLSAARYQIQANQVLLAASKFDFAEGCPSNISFIEKVTQGQTSLPADARKVDDPTPFMWQGHFYLMTRAWTGAAQYVYKFDQNMQLLDSFKLDLSSVLNSATISQNALVNINNQAYLISGLERGNMNSSVSGAIKAIPLSADLKHIAGSAVNLISDNNAFFNRVTRAQFVGGKLYFNYLQKGSQGNDQGYLAIMNVTNGQFTLSERILFQTQNAQDNHASFEVVGNKIYLFYQDTQENVVMSVLQRK